MADNGKGGSNNYSRMGRTTSPEENEEEEESAGDEQQSFISPDIGLGDLASQKFQRNLMGESSLGAVGGSTDGSSTVNRRDDVPFSLRHFLSGNRSESSRATGSSNVGGGARPKVYPGTPPPSPRLHPEITSGLPDFVQDHLVVEQVYLNSTGPLSSLALDNIPPQLPPSPDGAYSNRVDLPFDLTARSDSHETPLDLPPLGIVDVGPSKSLPDFLSDGPIRSERRHDSQPVSAANSPDREIGHALSLENSRLRRELEILKTQLSIQMTRSESLEREVNRLRNRDRNSASFDSIIEQLEENLSRMTRRAVTAENKIARLKQENQALKTELETARSNCRIRESSTSAASSSQPQSDNERLASQLRNAANTAELSLRQLLVGVENLRTLASSLDSGQTRRLENSSSDSGDDEPGPAL
uniref:Endosome-associated-trafficking regulator 1 n=2 Tax=Triatoma infestans TaxID=30076 RepID=A0A023EYS4_TRIIF